jgi:hypothetical protein
MNVISMEAAARSWTEPRFRILIGQFELLCRFGAKLGPYVLLELLLPGGTLFALLLFLYQRWKLNARSLPTLIRLASPPALVSTLGRGILAMQPERKGEERSWNAPLGIVRSDRARAQANFSGARAEVSIK